MIKMKGEIRQRDNPSTVSRENLFKHYCAAAQLEPPFKAEHFLNYGKWYSGLFFLKKRGVVRKRPIGVKKKNFFFPHSFFVLHVALVALLYNQVNQC